MPSTARQSDLNGYIQIKDNPISKVGVFPYLAGQIGHGGDDPNRVVNVFRSAEALSDPECIESFKLMPFINDHTMLGDGETPAELVGIEGVIGEQVKFVDPFLVGNLMLHTDSIKKVIDSGKVEISAGYRSKYIPQKGVYNGEPYEFVQVCIRANHVALVDEGRAGPEVSVLDSMTITLDAKDVPLMGNTTPQKTDPVNTTDADDTKPAEGIEAIKALLEQLKPLLEAHAEAGQLLADAGLIAKPMGATEPDGDETGLPVVTDEASQSSGADTTTTDEDTVTVPAATMDAILKRIDVLEKGQSTLDHAVIFSIAKRDELAGKLSEFVGTFDHKQMTLQQVEAYGLQKLGLKAPKGTESAFLEGFLSNRKPARLQNTTDGINASPSMVGGDILKTWGAK